MTAAALREGFTGPLFIQGDHVQVNAKKYAVDAETELQAIRTLIEEELHAGFYNIDVDTSTLVELSHPTLDAQQRVNYERAADLTKFIRDREPEGVTVSVGAEIGEVGGKNSDVHELKAFMDGYVRALARLEGGPYTGISKISVQTGTSHGGVVLPDGSIAKVQLDLDALKALSADARSKYGLGGAVQHGASTLPPGAFGSFPKCEAIEIHLATNFQNIVFDHPKLPADLRRAGVVPFLLGLGLGAVLGFLFAPEPGEASRTKLSRKLRGLRDLATEKAGELGELLDTAEDEEEEAPTARVAIERRLTEAKRRRRGGKSATSEEEEGEPVA